MSVPTLPLGIPLRLRAGESLNFLVPLADYSAAAGFAITWSFRSATDAIDFTSTPDGVNHLVSVPFTETQTWAPGEYSGVAMVSDGTIRKQVWGGSLLVLPDLAGAQPGEDFRSQVKRTLDNINAVLEKRANATILSSTIEGTSLGRIPMDQLLMLKDRYDLLYARELIDEDLDNGGTSSRTTFARFTPIR